MAIDSSFDGVIGRTYRDSKEGGTPNAAKAPQGAPDVIFVVLDDVGYSDLGCYGSEIDTPSMDRLAQGGARYSNFHVMPMCSPTRACLLTGRNSHSVGMGTIAEWAGGFPGYRGLVSNRAATIAEILRDHAYATIAVGKWHLTPLQEVSAAGPYANWPLGRGFDRWYGFQAAFADQWNPELYQDNQPIERPARDGYHHVVDVVPTVLDVLNIEAPASYRGIPQMPVHGTSMKYSFNAPNAPTRKISQFFELAGDRAIWHRGWKAVTKHKAGTEFDADQWALYHLDQDFSECRDLSQTHPEKLAELVDLWWAEAKALGALPLDDKWAGRSSLVQGTRPRRSYTFYPGLERTDRFMAPDISGSSYSITADVGIPEGGAEGVLIAFGTSLAGYVLYVKNAKLVHEFIFSGKQKHVISSDIALTAGRHLLRYDYARDAAGRGLGTLFIDSAPVGTIPMPKIWPMRAIHAGLSCGRDSGLAVSDAYHCPFKFTGIIHAVIFELGEVTKSNAEDAALAVWPPPLAR